MGADVTLRGGLPKSARSTTTRTGGPPHPSVSLGWPRGSLRAAWATPSSPRCSTNWRSGPPMTARSRTKVMDRGIRPRGAGASRSADRDDGVTAARLAALISVEA